MQKKTYLFFFAILWLAQYSFSQKNDSAKNLHNFKGLVAVTNNGISFVPTFSLEKPAVILNLSMGSNRVSFEPDLRFSLVGRPWSFLFWGRYKLINGDRLQMNVGSHLGLNFKTSVLPINGDSVKATVTRRYLAGELFPRYSITKNISAGVYYLYSHGIDAGTIKHTHFITLNATFSNIKLADPFFLRVNPQFYYLKLDRDDGFYFTSSFTLSRANFPLSVSAIINKVIETDITGKNFVWNASLVYSFNHSYATR